MKALIVEDEHSIAQFLKKSLESEYFAVDHAPDGEKGSYLGRLNDYDIIILDNMLPKKTGYQVCQELRTFGKTTPVLVLSVQTEVDQRVKLLNAGADDYVMKPFSFDEVYARIRALLRRPKSTSQEIVSVDDLTLNKDTHEVKRGDREIYLTRKEFMLLHFLLKNKGAVMSRGKIMENVWDMNADPFSNTIESHILSLRKKINFPGERKIITTISGRGYKIEE